MIISEERRHKIWGELSRTLVDKVSDKENVNWKRQFRHLNRVVNLIHNSLAPWDQAQIERYKTQVLDEILSEKFEVDLNNFQDINQIMSFLMARLVSMTEFMSVSSSRLIDKDSSFAKGAFTYAKEGADGLIYFDYNKELAAVYRYLKITEMAYDKQMEQGEMDVSIKD